jgi:retinol dehydrogenase-12
MELLIPVLSAGARTSSDRHSRIVWTSSSGAYVGVHDLAVYRPGPARDKRSPSDIYADSKLGNALVAREAARRYTDRNIVVTSVNPGNIQTNLDRNFSPFARWMVVSSAFSRRPLARLMGWTVLHSLSARVRPFGTAVCRDIA